MSDHEKLREAIKAVNAYTGQRPKVGETYAAMGKFISTEQLQLLKCAAESTLPKTKMVEVWHVEYAWKADHDSIWLCLHKTCRSKESAAELASSSDRRRLEPSGQFACIRVTGPHQQEVPA